MRAHILSAAQRLFYWDGIRATGVDRIAGEAGVAPVSLYRAFGSKDGLVAAYVAANAEGYRAYLTEQIADAAGSGRAQILRLFEAVWTVVQPDVCRGCPFLMTLAEFPDPTDEAHRIAVETKQWSRDLLRHLVADLVDESRGRDRGTDQQDAAGPSELDAKATLLADHLALLLEGVYASVQALGVDGPARLAGSVAEAAIDSFLRQGSASNVT